MKITFHGAAKTVTGSQHIIETNGYKIMLDCGLFQGKRKEAFELNRNGFCDGSTIDAVILSHAHIDHSGNLPCLVKNGLKGEIITTSATRDLCAVMLMDSAFIQGKDVEYVNRKRKREGKNLFEPLYTKEDVVHAMEYFTGVSYNRKRQILPGVHLTMVDAGHMLGSSHVILDIDDRDTGKEVRLVFSGDIGRPDIPIIRDPVPITEGADILLIESTYGDRTHPPYPESEKQLQRVVKETYKKGGTLLIPAFSVGRTQQIVYALHRLSDRGDIPELPIFVDSPLATRATDIFRLHPETYDAKIREFMLQVDKNDPFGFENMRYTQTVQESKDLNFLKEPAVIISASGMMEGGRILHHLRDKIEDPQNTILITGWQAPNTTGRRIVERQPVIRIFGDEFKLGAQVEVLTGFSGHADRDGLIGFVNAMEKKPQRTFIVHGEEDSASALMEGLRSEAGLDRIDIPDLHQEFEI